MWPDVITRSQDKSFLNSTNLMTKGEGVLKIRSWHLT